MKITQKEGGASLESEKLNYYIGIQVPKSVEGYTKAVGNQKDPNILHRPGEYEFGEFGVTLYELKKATDATADIARLELEGVGIVVPFTGTPAMKKDAQEVMSDPDILLLLPDLDLPNDLVEFTHKSNPQAIVVLKGSRTLEDIAKKMDMQVHENAKTLSFKKSDFSDEDGITHLYILE